MQIELDIILFIINKPNMIEYICLKDKNKWNNIVTSFIHHDIYYLPGYLAAFHLHGDGEPILVSYQGEGIRGICVYMLRDIANEKWVTNDIKKGEWFDVVTPYGYGGWIFEGDLSEPKIKTFWKEYTSYMKNQHIVCAFTRWHALLQNQNILRGFSNIIDLGKTVHIDTSNVELIMQNIRSKDRTTIRKAVKNGVIVDHSNDPSLFEDFIRIYNSTMDKDNAEKYYYFEKEFYDSIVSDMPNNWEMFYALLDGKIIAMSIILFCNGMMHYHLSGSLLEYRKLNATNLILYEAAVYGAKHGYSKFHLGGGVGSGDDPLYKFKKSFNKNSDNQFSISKDIFDKEVYQKIVSLRKKNDLSFNEESSFFPLYRS